MKYEQRERGRDSVFITYVNNQVFIVALAAKQAKREISACQQKQMCCFYCISASNGRAAPQLPYCTQNTHAYIQRHKH